METIVFDGKAAAAKIKEELKKEALEKGLKPSLAVILMGENPASLSYINQKKKACEELGWDFRLINLPASSAFENLKFQISNLNEDYAVHGLVLQLPLPPHLNPPNSPIPLNSLILPNKDIDGLNPTSKFLPPTAQAVTYVLTSEKIKIDGAKVVVLGRGKTAGAPIARLLKEKGADVFVAHSQTPSLILNSYLLNSDIIISCVGQPNLITGEMIKEGAVVIGVGLSRLPESESARRADSGSLLRGDLDEKSLMGKASLITPTPGGIGPLTVAFLLKNLLQASK